MKKATDTWLRETAFSHQPDNKVESLLGEIPGRWGRMTPLSRLVILETAIFLKDQGVLSAGEKLNSIGARVGLIGGTIHGSLHTDLAYIDSGKSGPGLASPALFGYTLPNIPLAEAAVTFGLEGPVYALFSEEQPLQHAAKEAMYHLRTEQELDFMLACEFEHYMAPDQHEELMVTLTVVKRDEDSNDHISKVG